MGTTNQRVIEAFFGKKTKYLKGYSIYGDEADSSLRSKYNHMLAIERLAGAPYHFDNTHWFIINGDTGSGRNRPLQSSSITRHVSMTFRVGHMYPRVSFSACRAAGIDLYEAFLVDFWEDEYSKHIDEGEEGFETFTAPVGATVFEQSYTSHDGEKRIRYKWWHRLGTVVLEQDSRYFICSMDERQYFVSELPHKVCSVKEAFESLKPRVVKEAFDQGLTVLRQGEWFFIPAEHTLIRMPKLRVKDWRKQEPLPREDRRSGKHIVARSYVLGDGLILCKGKVKHDSGERTRSGWGRNSRFRVVRHHATLDLGENIYLAFRNTAKGSWGPEGSVD